MKKIISVLAIVSIFSLNSGVANAQPKNNPAIPDHAVQVSENVYFLGQARDPKTGKMADGYLIAHPKVGKARPGSGSGSSSSCYGFMANGAKWKSLEPWVVNTSNPDNIASSSIFNLLSSGIAKWEDAADGTIGSGSVNILGNGTTTNSTLVADETSMDNQNEVYFDDLGDGGTIAVTIVWGIFGGNPNNRQLVEWDQVYNTYYSWATDGNASDMDFDSIATHELGHSVGMADLYQLSCSEETMYGYGSEGETKARTLNIGDITGINKLY